MRFREARSSTPSARAIRARSSATATRSLHRAPARPGSHVTPPPRPARPRADGKARNPGDGEVDGNEDELVDRVPGDLVDEGRRSADHDRQSEASPPDVPKVPEQECDRQPDREEGLGERDQQRSTNEIPAAKSQYAAGPANGNHRRANTGSTRIASAGRQNHSVVVGAPDEPRPSTTSSIATIASSAISRSNQYVPARRSIRLTR